MCAYGSFWAFSAITTGALPVPANLGTPGLANSKATPQPAPAIFAVQHSPAIPAANQAVVVTARFHDLSGFQAKLLYRIDTKVIANPSYTALAMNDNGTGGDALAGDGFGGQVGRHEHVGQGGELHGRVPAFQVGPWVGLGDAHGLGPGHGLGQIEALFHRAQHHVGGGIEHAVQARDGVAAQAVPGQVEDGGAVHHRSLVQEARADTAAKKLRAMIRSPRPRCVTAPPSKCPCQSSCPAMS